MITITIYDLSSGQIQGIYSGPEASIDVNVPDGCGYILGSYQSTLYEVRDGVAVEKSEDELTAHHNEMLWLDLRSQRDYMLAACDWTQVPDAPVDQAAWAAYRQQLRDLPANTTDPRNPAWPIPPA